MKPVSTVPEALLLDDLTTERQAKVVSVGAGTVDVLPVGSTSVVYDVPLMISGSLYVDDPVVLTVHKSGRRSARPAKSTADAVSVAGISIGYSAAAEGIDVSLISSWTVSGSGLGLTGGGPIGSNPVLVLTSSSNPGIAASILATNSAGELRLAELAVGPVPYLPAGVYSSFSNFSASDSTALRVDLYSSVTATGPRYSDGIQLWSTISVPSGVTNSGYARGFYSAMYRSAVSNDDGTLSALYAGAFGYGHYGGSTSKITTNVYGFSLTLYRQTGTISNAYGIYLGENGTATVTSYWSIYSAASGANMYHAGSVGIGVANAGIYKLNVFGNTNASGVGVTAFKSTPANATNYTRGLYTVANIQVNTGVTDSGSYVAFYNEALRINNASDAGTLANLWGNISYVGHYSGIGAGAVTTNAFGQDTVIYRLAGTITNVYAFRINESGSGTVTNYWSLYSIPAGARMYHNGSVAIGTTTVNAKLGVLSTSEQLRIQNTTSQYWSTTVSSTGVVSMSAVGSAPGFQWNQYMRSPTYVSQLTGWNISPVGEADFRYLYADELHVKLFIADLEQALAGGQIISKSVAVLHSDFTAPTPGVSLFLVVKSLPSAPSMAVFSNGDFVRVRNMSRSGGGLTVTDCWGTVTLDTTYGTAGINTSPGPDYATQRYTFTRSAVPNAGAMAAGEVVPKESLILDYGVSGDGYIETSAIDGYGNSNAPYTQAAYWITHPTNKFLGTRSGKLTGVTGVAGEYGFFAGTSYTSSVPYVRISNVANEINNISLRMFQSGSNVITIDPASAYPYISVGVPAPTAWIQGSSASNGFIAQIDYASGKTYFRVGETLAYTGDSTTSLVNGIIWDGGLSKLIVKGSFYIQSGEMVGAMSIGSSGGIWQGSFGTFSSPNTGLKIYQSGGNGIWEMWSSGSKIVYLSTSPAALYAGAGTVELSGSGIQIYPDATYSLARSYSFYPTGGYGGGFFGTYATTSSTSDFLSLRGYGPRSQTVQLYARVMAASAQPAFIHLRAESENNSTYAEMYMTNSETSFYSTVNFVLPGKNAYGYPFSCLSVGDTATDFSGSWGSGNVNMVLHGSDNTSIIFHDSGSGVGRLRFNHGAGFNIGENIGFGVHSLTVGGSVYSGSWVRTIGNTGWYSETYGGGWYMIDTTWIRSYNSKNVYIDQKVRADAGFQTGPGANNGTTYPVITLEAIATSAGADSTKYLRVTLDGTNYKIKLYNNT